jgi:hypothetical protein
MVFKAVAMQVDDPGKDQKAAQIYLWQSGAGQPPFSQADRARLHLAITQNLRAGQAQGGKKGRHHTIHQKGFPFRS